MNERFFELCAIYYVMKIVARGEKISTRVKPLNFPISFLALLSSILVHHITFLIIDPPCTRHGQFN